MVLSLIRLFSRPFGTRWENPARFRWLSRFRSMLLRMLSVIIAMFPFFELLVKASLDSTSKQIARLSRWLVRDFTHNPELLREYFACSDGRIARWYPMAAQRVPSASLCMMTWQTAL